MTTAREPDHWLIFAKAGQEKDVQVIQLKGLMNMRLSNLRMPFTEFRDSALALASLAQGDTTVTIGLPATPVHHIADKHDHWVGIADHPKRMISTPHLAAHDDWIEACKRMGKTPRMMACKSLDETPDFSHALVRMSYHECAALLRCMSAEGPVSIGQQLALHAHWYTRPNPRHRPIRIAILSALFTMGITMLATNHSIRAKSEITLTKMSRHATSDHTNKQAQQNAVDWQAWVAQLQKFGKDERANLTSLAWTWNTSGEVHTQVTLERPRKRLPKGCALSTPDTLQAVCSPVKP
ncbi:MAG TPA: hypothetical protein VFV43_01070 [Limnobacter sp.]|nr:hypothetical protein [Limnobacter sp.]